MHDGTYRLHLAYDITGVLSKRQELQIVEVSAKGLSEIQQVELELNCPVLVSLEF